jgi:predicted acyl esterase
MKKRGSLALLILVILAIGSQLSLSVSIGYAEKISRPLEYAGYSFPEFTTYQKLSEYVAMPDGANLAVDIYLPSGGSKNGPFPAILFYTPYVRATIDPQNGQIKMFMNPYHEDLMRTFTSYGYAVVTADMRGSGASDSFRVEMSPQLGEDGKNLVDWMGSQAWCDGSVGMYGGSYMGWSQFAVASERPAALKCIMPEVMAFDMYEEFHYPGGILNRLLVSTWGPRQILFDMSLYNRAINSFPAAPVVDEDGDGSLADEIPLDLNGNFVFIDDLPTYPDGIARSENIYYMAIAEHLDNTYPHQFIPGSPYRDSILPILGYSLSELHPNDWPVKISDSGIPIYNIGAWFDIFTRATTRWYSTMKETNPSKMLMHPSFHSLPGYTPPSMVGPYWSFFGEDVLKAAAGFNQEKLRFFDRYLKGIENGLESEPPIFIYVMNGEGWRYENEWPPARKVTKKYYFDKEKSLTTKRATVGADDFLVDLTHSSRYGTNKMTRWRATVDQVMKRTDLDLKCLTYTSQPLEDDMEVTGHPIVHLWVSSTAPNGDFFVYLEDVDEHGEAYYVTEGLLRAGFARLVPQEELLPLDSPIDVKPDLPFHGFKSSDYVEDIFVQKNSTKLVIDLMPTSWVFRKGHKVRVSIAGADWPTFDLNPILSPSNNPSDPNNLVPRITVHRGLIHSSHIELPVIPRKPILFEGKAKIKTRHLKYNGPAELYTFKEAVYLHFDDQWLKWETTRNWEGGPVEHYRCENDLGKLAVLVKPEGHASFEALATGRGIYFKGQRK